MQPADPLCHAAVGRLRWAVNSTLWKPEGDQHGKEFQFLLSLIEEAADREQVTKFHFFVDQKRALLSRLLCRRACAAVLRLGSFKGLQIARTKGRKPFLLSPLPEGEIANFNFNVSHEGDWVVLASEPICVCGVDVSAPHEVRLGATQRDVFEDVLPQLTADEWKVVHAEAALRKDDPPGYQAFQRFWSAKEAFVKARGDGLGFEPLSRAEFRFEAIDENTNIASVKVDGTSAPLWKFYQHRLGASHWVTVARGPTSDVVDADGAFIKTLRRPTPSFSAGDWSEELSRESPRFEEISVGFLVPDDDVARYELTLAVSGAENVVVVNKAMPTLPQTLATDSPAVLKDRGNTHFRAKEYSDACMKYTEAIHADAAQGSPDGGSFLSQLYSNRAACHLQLEDFDAALLDAGRAVQLDQRNGKAFFRKGRAFLSLDRPGDALDCLERALDIGPRDTALEKLIEEVRQKVPNS